MKCTVVIALFGLGCGPNVVVDESGGDETERGRERRRGGNTRIRLESQLATYALGLQVGLQYVGRFGPTEAAPLKPLAA